MYIKYICIEKDRKNKYLNVNSDYCFGGRKKDDFYFYIYILYFLNVL